MGLNLAKLLLRKGYAIHGIKRRSSLFNTDRIDTFTRIHTVGTEDLSFIMEISLIPVALVHQIPQSKKHRSTHDRPMQLPSSMPSGSP